MNPFSLIITLFNTFFFAPIINVMVIIIHGFNLIGLAGSLGFSIIVMTIIIRFLMWPLMSAQLRSAKKMADLKPHLDRLKEKHKGDKQKFAAAQMALFKEHGINPAAGCLPSLLQIPVLIALYQTIFMLFDSKSGLSNLNNLTYSFVPDLQKMPDSQFLGFNLAHKPSEFAQYGWVLLLIPVITAFFQFIQSKMMSPKPVKPYPGDSSKEIKEKEKTKDTMSVMQNQMIFMMPLMVGFFSWQFPIGLALYWNTFTIFGIIQQYKITGLGGLSTWIKKK